FFFQAEDGIRDKLVTGVQTCALPISLLCHHLPISLSSDMADAARTITMMPTAMQFAAGSAAVSKPSANGAMTSQAPASAVTHSRSEERRVGKEWRVRRSRCDEEKGKW